MTIVMYDGLLNFTRKELPRKRLARIVLKFLLKASLLKPPSAAISCKENGILK